MRYEEREFITMYQIDYTNVGKRMKTLRKAGRVHSRTDR